MTRSQMLESMFRKALNRPLPKATRAELKEQLERALSVLTGDGGRRDLNAQEAACAADIRDLLSRV